MKEYIAVFVNTLDPLFLSEDNKKKFFYIIASNAALHDIAKANLPQHRIISVQMFGVNGYPLSEKKILHNKLFLKGIKQKQITHLVVPHRCTKVMKEWAEKYAITLLGPSYALQQKLENKIYFDRLLKKNNIKSPATFTKKTMSPTMKYVIQNSLGCGLVGTTFATSKEDGKKIIKKSKRPLLIREYKNGISIGVSIFVDGSMYSFSAFRRQCFTYRNNFPNTFMGIQWLPTTFFTKTTLTAIQENLEKLALALINKKFKGIANIDILIHNNQPYVLECNPRLSSATVQLFSVPKLTQMDDPYMFFINTFLGKKNIHVASAMQSSTFAGSLIEVDMHTTYKITTIIPSGVYKLERKNLIYCGNKMSLLRDDTFLMVHELVKPGIYKDIPFFTVITTQQLFDTKTGALNKKGKTIYTAFVEKFTRA